MDQDAQLYFDDFKVGDRFRSPGRTLGDAHFLLFSGLTGDNHPLHYDEEYARQTRFGARVAHGLLVMAMSAVYRTEAPPGPAGRWLIERLKSNIAPRARPAKAAKRRPAGLQAAR